MERRRTTCYECRYFEAYSFKQVIGGVCYPRSVCRRVLVGENMKMGTVVSGEQIACENFMSIPFVAEHE